MIIGKTCHKYMGSVIRPILERVFPGSFFAWLQICSAIIIRQLLDIISAIPFSRPGEARYIESRD